MSVTSVREKILLVVGRKKVGKTTLIERLLPALKAKGYRVGCIKYTTGEHQFDTPGKDSYRQSQAGAETTVVISPGKTAVFLNATKDRQLDDVLDLLFQEYDLVLGEGFRSSPLPKIEVCDPDGNAPPLCSPEDNLIALVSKKQLDMGVPCFSPESLDPLVEFIEQSFLRGKGEQS